ncbi:MAG: ComF family protein [Rhodobacteraceae bacterium]|nr:ComF family protein [Paracoccaceae bacterium]
MKLQSAIRLLYLPQCLCCGAETTTDFALCAACWRDAPFITGLACDACNAPLPGVAGEVVHCDACLIAPKPWARGRAVMRYDGTARRLVLGLKHGDRQDLVPPMARWMADRARPLCTANTLIAPVPLHRWRFLKRRFNQSALMAGAMAKLLQVDWCPDLLQRCRATRTQDGMSREERYANQKAALEVPVNRQQLVAGRDILIVDDVMTSGATLSAAAEACFAAGAALVDVVVLARVARDA